MEKLFISAQRHVSVVIRSGGGVGMIDISLNRKEWLDVVYYDIGMQRTDFFVSGLKLIDGNPISTKWYKYSEKVMVINPWEDYKIKWINQRQVLKNEIVIDLEEKESFDGVCKKLEENNNYYYAYDTGSRGYHIHIFFKFNLTQKQKDLFIKKYFGDRQLSHEKHMINLEFSEHWKSGKIKKLVKSNGN